VILFALWLVGQLARDRTWLTGLCFYIPSALVATVLIGWSILQAARRRWRLAGLSIVLALLPLAMVVFVENRWGATPAPLPASRIRIVHWNVFRRLPPGSRDLLVSQQADIYVLSEIPNEDAVVGLRTALGDNYRSLIFGDLAVILAGEIVSSKSLSSWPRVQAQLVTFRLQGRPMRVLVIDLPSSILIARDPLLREVNRLIEEHIPDLVVGDFNAPRRSQALSDLPAGYQHAFETAGCGCGYTWPVPVPMYALDQCLHSPRIVPARYELHSTFRSDHRMQVFDFSW
jgi:endonuclease/exonuclease/phosphatase (EEP) superfamily protein YafD